MLKTTLSVVTAVVLGMSGLNAEVLEKAVKVSVDSKVPDVNVITEVNSIKKDIAVVVKPTEVIAVVEPSVTQSSVVINTENQKVTIEETLPVLVPNVDSYDDTIVYAQGVKNNYKVGEEIKIKLQLKRDAYIYFWTVSYDGKGYLILPNDFNVVTQYQAHKDHLIPEASAAYQFASDRAGVEEVYVLATSKPISLNKIKSIFSEKSSGIVPTASRVNIVNFVTKDLIVIAKTENLKYDISHFQVGVHNVINTNKPSINIIINR